MQMALIAAAMGLALKSQAAVDIDISFTSSTFSGTGVITQETSDGGGIYTATAGTFTVTSGFDSGATFFLDPITSGSQVVVENPINSGGGNLNGDNQLGQDYISNLGLIFTSPAENGNTDGGSIDAINLWGNGGSSYTAAFMGPDFPAGVTTADGTGTVNLVAAPEPKATPLFAGVSALGMVGLVTLRRKLPMMG